MAADGPRQLQPSLCASHEALKPVAAPRVPLSAQVRSISGALPGPEIARLHDELSMVKKALRAERAESRVEKLKNEQLTAQVRALTAGSVSPLVHSSAGLTTEDALESQHRLRFERLRNEYEARVRELEETCARELALLEEKHAAKLSALRNSLSAAEELTLAKNERIRRLEARLSRLHTEGAELHMAPSLSDDWEDLTVLRGVGPVYALALRRHGVCTLGQIANWTPEDVAAIAPKIGTTETRIFREAWVLQARKFRR